MNVVCLSMCVYGLCICINACFIVWEHVFHRVCVCVFVCTKMGLIN